MEHHQGFGPLGDDGRSLSFTPGGALNLAYGAPSADSGAGSLAFTGLVQNPVHLQGQPYMQSQVQHHQQGGYHALQQLAYSDAPHQGASFTHVPSYGQLSHVWSQAPGWGGGTPVIIQPAAAAVIYPIHVLHPMAMGHPQHGSERHYSSSSNTGGVSAHSGSKAGSETGMPLSYAMPPPATPTPLPPLPAGYSSGGYGDLQPPPAAAAAGVGGGGRGGGVCGAPPLHRSRSGAAAGLATPRYSQRGSAGNSRSSSQPSSWVPSECSNSVASTDLDTASLGYELPGSVAGCSSVGSGGMAWGSTRKLPVLPDAMRNQSWAWLVEGILQQIMQGLAGNGHSLKQFRLACRHWKAVADCNLRALRPSSLKPRDLVLLFPRLQVLELVRCPAVRNRDLYVLAHSPLQLQSLTLGDDTNRPWVTNRGLVSIGHMLTLQQLALHDCNSITNNGLTCLSGLSALVSLSLRGCRKITNNGLEVLAALTGLSSLNLYGCSRISDLGVPLLEGLPLRALSLGNTRVRDEGVGHLVKLTGLTELALTKEEISDAAAGQMTTLTNLRSLALRELTSVSGAAVQRVLSELPQLEHVDLQKACDFGDPQLAASLPTFTRLSSLDLRGTWVTPRGLAGLSSVRSLRRLALSIVPQPPGSEGYALLSRLEQLRGLCCQGEELGGALMGALVQLPNLRYLDISSSAFGRELSQAPPLAPGLILGLGALSKLQRLDLSRRPLSEAQLRQLLLSCRALQELRVLGAPLTWKQVVAAERDFPDVNIMFKPAPVDDAAELAHLVGSLSIT